MEQLAVTFRKWDPSNPNCVFRHYFYNKVDETAVPFYLPGPNEDPKEWEEALQNKPGQGFIPVLCSGFAGVANRLQTQNRVVGELNVRMHQINASLDAILSRHDLETTVRALAARRRHVALRERCLGLAAKVQVLRNRGYALSGDEDDLRVKLAELDRSVQDPALSAREEELWSRLIVLRGYADRLMKEANKPAFANGETLNEETEVKVKKVYVAPFCGEQVNVTDHIFLTGLGRLRKADSAPQEGGRFDHQRFWGVGEGYECHMNDVQG